MGKNSQRSRHRRDRDPEAIRQAKIRDYYRKLIAVGMPEREATRAAMFVDVKGFDAMNAPDGADACVMFDEPSCGNWNCLEPDHQVLRFEHHGEGGHDHHAPT